MDCCAMENLRKQTAGKVYQLTAAGKKQLTRERSKWSQLSDAIAGVLQPEGK